MAKSTLIGFGILCLSVAGCNSTDDFVGTWKVTSGTTTVICEDGSDTTAVTGNVTFSEGSSSDLIMVDDDCSYKLDVDGERASLAGSQSCTLTPGGFTRVINTSSLTFSTTDGKVGHVSASGNLTDSAGGATATCTFSITADYEKL